MPLCEIIYVRHKSGNGWKWRPVAAGGAPKAPENEAKASEKTYQLFYECVTAARASGYSLNQKCL
jgi:hypothetical protein